MIIALLVFLLIQNQREFVQSWRVSNTLGDIISDGIEHYRFLSDQ